MTNAILSKATVFQPGTSNEEIEASAAQAARQRHFAVYFWRFSILVVFLAGWELATRFKLMDVFFFSSPLAITMRLVEWVVDLGVDRGEFLECFHDPEPEHRPASSPEGQGGTFPLCCWPADRHYRSGSRLAGATADHGGSSLISP